LRFEVGKDYANSNLCVYGKRTAILEPKENDGCIDLKLRSERLEVGKSQHEDSGQLI